MEEKPATKAMAATGMPIHRCIVAESPIHLVSRKPISMQAPGKPKPSNHMDVGQLMSVSCTEISSPSIFEE